MKTRLLILPGLALAAAIAVASASAGAAAKGPLDVKAGRAYPSVAKDIKDGKAKKIKSEKLTYGVWDGCKFHYLHADQNTYEFDDGSQAGVSENPDALPEEAKVCSNPRNPTADEMAAKNARVAEANGRQSGKSPQVPGGPPPPDGPPANAYRGG